MKVDSSLDRWIGCIGVAVVLLLIGILLGMGL